MCQERQKSRRWCAADCHVMLSGWLPWPEWSVCNTGQAPQQQLHIWHDFVGAPSQMRSAAQSWGRGNMFIGERITSWRCFRRKTHVTSSEKGCCEALERCGQQGRLLSGCTRLASWLGNTGSP